MAPTNPKMTSTKTRRSPTQFLRKYFWEGQKLTENQEEKLIELSKDASFTEILLVKYRRLLGILIPFMFFHTVYWLLAFRYNIFHLFRERYIMPMVMIFGGTIGGMTTEGGGAIAFPVMTLALHISPTVARDFSMMIQSCGIQIYIMKLACKWDLDESWKISSFTFEEMTHSLELDSARRRDNIPSLDRLSAASFTIFFMSIIVEWHSIIFSTIGGIFGVISGIEIIDPLMTSAQKKMAFVSVFLSFALALFLLNAEKKRITFDRIQKFNVAKAGILVVNGFIGGIFTGVAGSGIDVYSFSILTLLFRISEKVATPTSVVLMAANSIVGFFWRAKMQNEISQETWEYFIPSVIVVVTFAPLGSLLASHFHRLTLATLIYILEIVAFISALLIVKPSMRLLFASLLLITVSFIFYYFIAKIGKKMAANQMKNKNDEKSKNIASYLQV